MLISSGLMGKKQLHLSLSASEWICSSNLASSFVYNNLFQFRCFQRVFLIAKAEQHKCRLQSNDDDVNGDDSINNNRNCFYLMGSSAHLLASQSSTMRR
jgi:hypothetical protein